MPAKALLLPGVCVLLADAAERTRNLGSGAAVGGAAQRRKSFHLGVRKQSAGGGLGGVSLATTVR